MSPANANVHPQARRKMKKGRGEDQVPAVKHRKIEEEENREKTQFMDMSNDVFLHLFPYLGLAERRNLRGIGNMRLLEIEWQCKFHYGEIQICVNALVCDKVEIKMNAEEMKEELERLKAKTTFNRVICERSDPYDIVNAAEIQIYGVTDDDLPRVFANKKVVFIMESQICSGGSEWIYKGMLNRELAVEFVRVDMTDDDACYYEMMGILDWDEELDEDVPRENQTFTRLGRRLIVREEHLKMTFAGRSYYRDCGGCVFFRVVDEDDDDDDEVEEYDEEVEDEEEEEEEESEVISSESEIIEEH